MDDRTSTERSSNWVGPVRLSAHEETDEQPEYAVSWSPLPEGVTQLLAVQLASTNPLYEMIFEFYVNPVSMRYVMTKMYASGCEDECALTGPIPTTDDAGHPIVDEEIEFTWPG